MEFTGPEHDAGTPPGTRAPSDASSGHNGAAASGEARYRECLRNHAAAQGGHAVDGCGEYMPAGAHDLLRCAACGCHRSFHRRDDGQHLQHPHLFLPALAATQMTVPRVPLLMPPPQHHPYAAGHPHAPPFAYNPHHHHYQRTPSGGGTTTESSSEEPGPGPLSTSGQGHGQAQRRKRFRTRFTAEQREQMLALAERVGWRMLKQDEALVEQLCAQAGVRRQVFKVWMHNNKHHRRQPQPPQSQQQQYQQHQ